MNWAPRAAKLAATVTHTGSRWRGPISTVPRHEFVPRWWARRPDGWTLHDGPSTTDAWLATAYADRSLITSVAGVHADHATPDDRPAGRPTSSATLPSLVVAMFRHALLGDDMDLLDVGTGSGYGTALAARRLGEARVTSVDVDPYLTTAARDRLAAIGLRPGLETLDATADTLPGTFDRIVATVAVRPIPPGWLAALRTEGRLVTTITGTTLLVTATKQEDGTAIGRVLWDRAGFMHARAASGDYPPGAEKVLNAARTEEGEDIDPSPYPVVDVENAWDLAAMLDLTAPGIIHHYKEDGDRRIAVMGHPDGSWARATATGTGRAVVHQAGPRRLWDILDRIRTDWLGTGELPARGARVRIAPDGTTTLTRGSWRATL